jgi:Tfp pilus assembly PilM family ATPase
VGVSLSFQSEGVSKIIETTFNSVINEIRYSLDLYRNRGKTVEKIVLSGGSVFLPNLSQYLEKILNIKVHIGDPWQKVIYPEELKPVLQELGPRFAIAIGLAMREIVG